MTEPAPGGAGTLRRHLGLGHAVVVGWAAMLGAGVFVAYGPAAARAGGLLPLALALAAAIAWANADSTARLAAVLPTSGGAYTYGRAQLSPLWGSVAGWAFLVGKTASAGAIALTAGSYLWPGSALGARALAAAAVVALTALASRGVRASARVSAAVVVIVLVALAIVLAATTASGLLDGGRLDALAGADRPGVVGVLRGSAVLFFAFAGYARIATLGEEVVDPERTIPRAVGLALGGILVVYAVVGLALLAGLGVDALAATTTPVAALADATGQSWLGPVVAIGAALGALGSLLGVLLGLSRTQLAMARDGVLPRALAVLDSRRLPVRAQLLAGAAALVVVLLGGPGTAIVVSSTAVLTYYAVAHASAWRLPSGRARRLVPALGLAGCLALAASPLLPR